MFQNTANTLSLLLPLLLVVNETRKTITNSGGIRINKLPITVKRQERINCRAKQNTAHSIKRGTGT